MTMTRPHSLQELAQQAEIAHDPRISLNSYLRSIESLLDQARDYRRDDDLDSACILLVRAAKLAIEDLPKHPQWKAAESAKRKRVQNAGHDALSLLSEVKPRVSDRYERWRAAHPEETTRTPSPRAGKLVRKSKARSDSDEDRMPSYSRHDYRPSSPAQARVPDLAGPRPPSARPTHEVYATRPSYDDDDYRDGERRSDREDYERMIDDLTHDLYQSDLHRARPLSPRKYAMPPHLQATGGPSHRSGRLSPSYMTVHQRQQGYSDHGHAASRRSAINYPTLEHSSQVARPSQQELPHIYRSTSLLSLPRPPRPPKVKSGTCLISASKLAATESGQPLRDMLCPSQLIDSFVALAADATERNCETCGLLLGNLADNIFTVSVLLLPRQKGTPDTCETIDEEAIFNFQDARDLSTLAWIHTHPRQSCFLSSLDLHTHYGNQQMLAESVAIVCSPRKTPSIGIFRLTAPPGLAIIGSCTEPGAFHPHPAAPVYTDANYEAGGHFHLVDKMPLEIVDQR